MFKSPWAFKYGRIKSLSTFLKGFFSPALSPQELSVCVTCSNRLEMLTDVFIPSFLSLKSKDKIRLYISCHAQEEKEIHALCKELDLDAKVIPMLESFNRSGYLNSALDVAKSPHVFLTDVDIALPAGLYELFYKNVKEKIAWFPICDMLNENKKVSHAYPEGVGLVGFYATAKYRLNTDIKTWGNEDWDFLFKLHSNGVYPLRTQKDNFLHHYHEEADKKNYKKIW